MIQNQTTETLRTILSNVLADLAFMFTEDQEEAGGTTADVWLETEIGYRGPCRGTLRFHCTREFSIQLAANLLGLSPDDPQAESGADDAVREFMNIVCGQLITALHGTEAVFDLTIPVLRELMQMPSFADSESARATNLFVEGQRLHLVYTVDEPETVNT